MVTVALAESVHAEALAELAEEMVRFYGATEVAPLALRISQINESLFADPPSAYCLLAWDDGRPTGFAAYSFPLACGRAHSLVVSQGAVRRRDGTAKGRRPASDPAPV